MVDQIELNDIAKLIKSICNFGFFCGLPNTWIEDVQYSKGLVKFFKVWRTASNLVICIFMGLEVAALFTQKNMSEKQRSVSLSFSITHPIIFSFIVAVEMCVEDIKTLIRELVVALKSVHNDADVQRETVWKAKVYTSGFTCIFISALISYGIEAIKLVITGGTPTFTPVITCWPDIEDSSVGAAAAGVLSYVIWWIFNLRLVGVYSLIIPMTICLSHQYKNLQTYFKSLNNIFQEKKTQEENELKYVNSFKTGIKMHSHTLWCTKKFQASFGLIFSAQILVNVSLLVMLMVQMLSMDARTATNVAPIVTTGTTVLLGTGLFMCNAGDITVESAALAPAIYCSGWHECRAPAAAPLRHLVALAVAQAQQPVVLWAFGTVPLSYQSYVSIVKSSYSVFSVITRSGTANKN